MFVATSTFPLIFSTIADLLVIVGRKGSAYCQHGRTAVAEPALYSRVAQSPLLQKSISQWMLFGNVMQNQVEMSEIRVRVDMQIYTYMVCYKHTFVSYV